MSYEVVTIDITCPHCYIVLGNVALYKDQDSRIYCDHCDTAFYYTPMNIYIEL